MPTPAETLSEAIINNDLTLIAEILSDSENSALLKIKTDGMTPIVMAATLDIWETVRAIAQVPTDLSDEAGYGLALLLAAKANETDTVLALLAANAMNTHYQLQSDDYKGYTALHFAVLHDNLQLVESLRLGAAVSIKNQANESPMLLAAKEGKWPIVIALAELPMENTIQSDYEYALISAAQNGETSALKSLIQAGTPSDAQCAFAPFKGFTALHFAVTSDAPEMVEFLIQDNPLLMSIKDEKGNSPILLAARAEKWSIVSKLIKQTENKKDVDFNAVRDLARAANQFETLDLIDDYFLKIENEKQQQQQFSDQGNIIRLNLVLLEKLGFATDDDAAIDQDLTCPITFEIFKYPVLTEVHEQDAMPTYEMQDIQDYLKAEKSDPSGYGELTGKLIPHRDKQIEVIQFLKEQWQALLPTKMNDDWCDEKKMTYQIINDNMTKESGSFDVFENLDSLEDMFKSAEDMVRSAEDMVRSAEEARRFEQFKKAYFEKYNGTFFKNPFSTMRQKLLANEITSMKEVTDYVKIAPSSRTAKVLTEMDVSEMNP